MMDKPAEFYIDAVKKLNNLDFNVNETEHTETRHN
jgi:hypothetical protein